MNHLLVWLIFSPIVFITLLYGIIQYFSRIGFLILLSFSTLNLLISIALFFHVSTEGVLIYQVGGWSVWNGILLAADPIAVFLLLLIHALFLLGLFYSKSYFHYDQITYFTLLYLLQAGLVGMTLTSDLFNLYVFIEIVSIVSYALVSYEKTDLSIEAGFKYLVFGSFASFLIVWGIGLIYANTSALNLASIASVFSTISPIAQAAIFILLCVGFSAKVAFFPFHAWLPDAHATAPSPVSALLSGIMIKIPLFCLVRIVVCLYGYQFITTSKLTPILLASGVGSVLVGHCMALQQQNIKRLLAYSSIAHIGYILIGLSSLTAVGTIGSFYHILNHGLLKFGLFLIAGVLIVNYNIREVTELRGLYYHNRLLSIAFVILAFGMIGIPPVNGFFSKWLIIMGSMSAQHIFSAAVVAFGGFISLLYYLKMILLIVQPVETEKKYRPVDPLLLIPIGTVVVSCCLLFFFNDQVYQFLAKAVDLLVNNDLYLQTILESN